MFNASLIEEPNLTSSEPWEKSCEPVSFLSALIQVQKLLSCFKAPFLISRNVITPAVEKGNKTLSDREQLYFHVYV